MYIYMYKYYIYNFYYQLKWDIMGQNQPYGALGLSENANIIIIISSFKLKFQWYTLFVNQLKGECKQYMCIYVKHLCVCNQQRWRSNWYKAVHGEQEYGCLPVSPPTSHPQPPTVSVVGRWSLFRLLSRGGERGGKGWADNVHKITCCLAATP